MPVTDWRPGSRRRYTIDVASPAVQFEPDERSSQDQIVRLHGVTWADYQRLLEIRGDHSAPRITYLQGELEITSPSRTHESIKSIIGRLVEVWCLEKDIEFSTYGSWTLESKPDERGAEPDECYVFGEHDDPQRPDLAIEVVYTSGGIDKLKVYCKLGVREVWYWKKGKLQPYVLRGGNYEAIEASEVLAGIDLEQLSNFVDPPRTSRAVRGYRAALRSRS